MSVQSEWFEKREKNPLECPVCPLRFGNISNLKTHLGVGVMPLSDTIAKLEKSGIHGVRPTLDEQQEHHYDNARNWELLFDPSTKRRYWFNTVTLQKKWLNRGDNSSDLPPVSLAEYRLTKETELGKMSLAGHSFLSQRIRQLRRRYKKYHEKGDKKNADDILAQIKELEGMREDGLKESRRIHRMVQKRKYLQKKMTRKRKYTNPNTIDALLQRTKTIAGMKGDAASAPGAGEEDVRSPRISWVVPPGSEYSPPISTDFGATSRADLYEPHMDRQGEFDPDFLDSLVAEGYSKENPPDIDNILSSPPKHRWSFSPRNVTGGRHKHKHKYKLRKQTRGKKMKKIRKKRTAKRKKV